MKEFKAIHSYGVVTRVNEEKGFFFIKDEYYPDKSVFGHISKIVSTEMPRLDDILSYTIVDGEKGLNAIEIENMSAQQREKASEKKPQSERSNVLPFPEQNDVDELDLSLSAGHHFYIVFNPMMNENEDKQYNGQTQAHSFNNMLRDHEYLYWGKYKLSKSNESLDIDAFNAAIIENAKAGLPTNLYISDFHHFWAAKVESVHSELDFNNESKNTLEFYRKNWDQIELWFKITDMVLVANKVEDTSRYINELCIKKRKYF